MHQDWLGELAPVGLLVSAPALDRAQVVVSRAAPGLVERQGVLQSIWEAQDRALTLEAWARVFASLLEWRPSDVVFTTDPEAHRLESLAVPLRAYQETLRPDFAVCQGNPGSDSPWLILGAFVEPPPGADQRVQDAVFDTEPEDAPGAPRDTTRWQASPHARFERLLRENGVPVGLLCSPTAIRLVYAPKGEMSGYGTFHVRHVVEVPGRALLSALFALLNADRLFLEPRPRRLPALLELSRRYQNEVSTRLADQVLDALHELLRGFQAADAAVDGALLRTLSREEPAHIQGGLVTVLMRLVFLLYAEEQGFLPKDAVFVRHYALGGLFDRLRADHDRFPDTMDQRYGAYAWLLTLFRLMHDGGGRNDAALRLHLPKRLGHLFDPDRWPFLEGRPIGVLRESDAEARGVPDPPRVSDGCLYRVLDRLMMLEGERLSYRTLAVEQVGSVYEATMGFDLRRAEGPTLAVKPHHVYVDLNALLALKPAARLASLSEQADCDVPGKPAKAVEAARSVDDLVAALSEAKRVSKRTPTPVAPGTLYLQPGEERRRSGSHYTPPSLSGPVVRDTLGPVVAALGDRPTPDEILSLKVLDPAMGSGAFLVAAGRELAEALVAAWAAHDCTPADIPEDEDVRTHAFRLVAQRCLYGVDKNPFAVDLAKLSLWLATMAADHPFTFLDHCLRHGDALVGLTGSQILHFTWKPAPRGGLTLLDAEAVAVSEARHARARIHALGDGGEWEKREAFGQAERALAQPRRQGDLCVAAFFSATKDKAREQKRAALLQKLKFSEQGAQGVEAGEEVRRELDAAVETLREGERPVPPFHWEVEFPEVFGRENAGFDAVVGNPPFAGKNTVIAGSREGYVDWLKALHEGSSGSSDLVAHFFRRAFSLLRPGGCLGLIATNTVAQGDTRASGIAWIRQNGGTIYKTTRRVKWPGLAAVVVSIIHIGKDARTGVAVLDGRSVELITAFLFHTGGDDDPKGLAENSSRSFIGSYVLGIGFTFDDTSTEATPLAEMRRLMDLEPRNAERVFPYIGGEELNTSATQDHHRFVINFGQMDEAEARRWPDLVAIVESRVRGRRGSHSTAPWWQFERPRVELTAATAGKSHVLANSLVTAHLAFAIQPTDRVFTHNVGVYVFPQRRGPIPDNTRHPLYPASLFAPFAVMQSRVHEVWARFFGATLEDRLNYRPTDCFETFPFPSGYETSAALEDIGRRYYDFRAALMIRRNQGLTTTYNRFHDPEERDPDTDTLRVLHAEMDRAVLTAYGFTDLS
ncbi:MAG: Eco57I restriction-modification methylase domain-containing protein, partial [Bradymonadia bacterium]